MEEMAKLRERFGSNKKLDKIESSKSDITEESRVSPGTNETSLSASTILPSPTIFTK